MAGLTTGRAATPGSGWKWLHSCNNPGLLGSESGQSPHAGRGM